MKGRSNIRSINVDLSDFLCSANELENFFDRHNEWFNGDTIVIAEGPPTSSDENQLSVRNSLRFLHELSTCNYVRKVPFFAPSYVFCFSQQCKKTQALAYIWFLFDRLKIFTVRKCECQALEKVSISFSLDEDRVFDTTQYISICLKGEFDSELYLRKYC